MDIENQIDGTVCGSDVPLSPLIPGYTDGSRQDAHEFMSRRNEEIERRRVRGVEELVSTTSDPLVAADSRRPPLHAPASDRNRRTSLNGSVARQ